MKIFDKFNIYKVLKEYEKEKAELLQTHNTKCEKLKAKYAEGVDIFDKEQMHEFIEDNSKLMANSFGNELSSKLLFEEKISKIGANIIALILLIGGAFSLVKVAVKKK